MDILSVFFGWFVWCLVSAGAAFYWYQFFLDVRIGWGVGAVLPVRVISLTCLSSWFLIIPEWSKLHLLWLAPIVLLGSACLYVIEKPPEQKLARQDLAW